AQRLHLVPLSATVPRRGVARRRLRDLVGRASAPHARRARSVSAPAYLGRGDRKPLCDVGVHGLQTYLGEPLAMTLRDVLRLFTYLEGVSYLTLLLVAMPLKYAFDIPAAVRIVGGLHGVLFLAFGLLLYQAHVEYRWPRRFTLTLLAAALFPGSLMWLDRR